MNVRHFIRMNYFLTGTLVFLAGAPALVLTGCNTSTQPAEKDKPQMAKGDYVLVIHGGAGTILKKDMTPEKEAAFRAGLQKALETGYAALQTGKSSLDAVEATIRVLEDDSNFNAGKGAVFTHDGHNELDAAIMNGRTLAAGAVAGVRTIRNPITLARAVMEKSEHVLLTGRGAEQFAREAGVEIVDTSYFWTRHRWDDLQQAIREEDSVKAAKGHTFLEKGNPGSGGAGSRPGGGPGDAVAGVAHAGGGAAGAGGTVRAGSDAAGAGSVVAGGVRRLKYGTIHVDYKFGTVGCVALDKNGDLAAGTSTGGMTNKRYGRVGDSPLIGAGTYANNNTVAVSCTGWGEFYIRNVVAYDLSALVEYKGLSVKDAGAAVIGKVGKLGGDGGLIALDKNGNMTMSFNTDGMYRGSVTKDGKIEVYIYKD